MIAAIFLSNWVLATGFLLLVRTKVRENKRFPLVLILWWVFSSLVDVLSLPVRVVKDLEVPLWFWCTFNQSPSYNSYANFLCFVNTCIVGVNTGASYIGPC